MQASRGRAGMGAGVTSPANVSKQQLITRSTRKAHAVQTAKRTCGVGGPQWCLRNVELAPEQRFTGTVANVALT